MSKPIARSYLFVPGNRPERFDKACAAGADAVIVDLEDAVPAAEKTEARRALANWLSPQKMVLIRINAAGSDWFDDDLALCARPGVAGIVLPKAERIEDIGLLERAGAPLVLPLIESAQGFENARLLADCAPVQRLLFGSIDFKLDLGIENDGDDDAALLFFRSQLVLVSRLAGIQPPVDGVSTGFDDPQRMHDEALRARSLGFGGKLCIHPKQVAPVNRAFSPSADEVAWARSVLDASAAAGGAAVALDGRMIDLPVILRARRIIDASARNEGGGAD
jgi:citrate lyase subunit beta / citryl-CoA lyase